MSSLSWADAPPAPAVITVCSDSGRHCATSDLLAHKTRLIDRASGAVLWSLDQAPRYFFVSNDGRTIVVLSDFANGAPLDASPSYELFALYRNGSLLRSVRIADHFSSPSELHATGSDLLWGYFERVDSRNNAVFSLVNGTTAAYNLGSGARVAR